MTYLINRDAIQGYSDNTFRPNSPVTRAELLKMIFKVRGIQPEEEWNQIFPDVPTNQWYTGYVNVAYKRGIAAGYSPEWFLPHHPVSRAEAIKILLKAYDFGEYWPKMNHFNDVPRGAWYFHYIEYALSRGIIDQKAYFYPNSSISRAEVAKIITLMNSQ